MIEAAVKALMQTFSPAMRPILWRSIGLALILVVVLAIGLQRVLSWLATSGQVWAEASLGASYHTPLTAMAWIISIAAGVGIVIGAVFLMPAITSLVASVFVDDVADVVERDSYPAHEPGRALPLVRSLIEGSRTALITILVYVLALPFVFFAGIGVAVFFIATAWLLSREYFVLVAMRYHPVDVAKQLRQRHAGTIFTAGLIIAAFVSIPILNFATPLFGMAMMVHLYKQLEGPNAELLEPAPRVDLPGRI